jgi:hypothetical protein
MFFIVFLALTLDTTNSGDPERLLRLHCEDLLLMTRQVRLFWRIFWS